MPRGSQAGVQKEVFREAGASQQVEKTVCAAGRWDSVGS